jgi:hypothetical protein
MSWFSKLRGKAPLKPALDLTVLAERREAVWRQLGSVADPVVSRLVPGAVPWPSSALGKLRLIRRPGDALLVTDGLSDPYDPELHPSPPTGPLDFELCLAVESGDPSASSDEAIAAGPWPKLLYALADVLVEEWTDIRSVLRKFGAITFQAPIGRGFGQGLEKEGLAGYLLGMPLDGGNFDRQLYLNNFYAGLPVPYCEAAIGVFPVKVLRPSELEWAIAAGNEGGMLLAREFIARGEGCRNNSRLDRLH